MNYATICGVSLFFPRISPFAIGDAMSGRKKCYYISKIVGGGDYYEVCLVNIKMSYRDT